MITSIPYLTIEDKNNLKFFDSDERPALIVEGKSDWLIYSRVFIFSSLLRRFDIVVGESKNNILKYYNDNKIEFKYLILLDADYERFKGGCIDDENIIYTHYYTIENYLTLKDVVEKTFFDFMLACIPEGLDVERILEEVMCEITPFVVVSLMKMDNNWNIKLEDFKIDRWMDDGKVKIDILKNYVLKKLHDGGIVVDDNQFLQIYERLLRVFTEIPTDKKDCVIHGKRKLEVLFYVFKKYFPYHFKSKNIDHFTLDLLKNIQYSNLIKELISNIDERMQEYCT